MKLDPQYEASEKAEDFIAQHGASCFHDVGYAATAFAQLYDAAWTVCDAYEQYDNERHGTVGSLVLRLGELIDYKRPEANGDERES